jgi:hypothetical protein
MLFAILTVVTLAGAAFQRSHLRFRAYAGPETHTVANRIQKPGYLQWLALRYSQIVRPNIFRKILDWFEDWTSRYYPGWMKWIFAAMVLSFLYLAASGFFYAVFVPRGMFGFPLVAHVSLGGVFAVCLAFVAVWRARDYAFDKQEETVFQSFVCPIFKNLSVSFVGKILFWGNALAGLLIILSALFSMLPVLPAAAQQPLLELHRYAALASALTMIVFADAKLIPAQSR